MHAFTEFASAARAAFKREEVVDSVPDEMLMDSATDDGDIYVLPAGDVHFSTRFLELGRFLTGIIPDRDYDDVRLDAGLWSGVGGQYFNQLTNGRAKDQRRARLRRRAARSRRILSPPIAGSLLSVFYGARQP